MIVNNNETPDVSRLNIDQTRGSSRAAGARASKPAIAGSAPADDSISLSNTPSLVQQALNSTSSARSDRVQELKALIQNNRYQPDAQQISQALINAHLTGE